MEAVSAILYPSVLVAEDSVDTRIMLKQAFEMKGYRVFEAEDGKQALEMATLGGARALNFYHRRAAVTPLRGAMILAAVS